MELFEPKLDKIKSFLDEFSRNFCVEIGVEDALPYRISSIFITEDDLEAEVLDWVFSYLTANKAPNVLACILARETLTHVQQWDLKKYTSRPLEGSSQEQGDGDDDDATDILDDEEPMPSDKLLIDTYNLGRDVFNKLSDVCKNWAHTLPTIFNKLPQKAPFRGISMHAIRNGRRKMEDRHVVLPYLNTLFPQLKGDPQEECFLAVYDGHGGSEAASFAAAHLHHYFIQHGAFVDDPITALGDAFRQTDSDFIKRCRRERVRSGSTAVAALVRDRKLYLSWLGDSQALLVKDGRPVEVMRAHKPEREDERKRIEDAGGFVVYLGTWRVNATLSVSRAIGDADYKPYVSGEPDVMSLPLTGDEDYVILACDGLWDTLNNEEVVTETYNYLKLSTGSKANLASYLSQRAKEKGSTDNISVVILFLRDQVGKPKPEATQVPLVAEEDDQISRSQGGDSDSRGGDPDSQSGNPDSPGQEGGLSGGNRGSTTSEGAKQTQQQQKDSDLFGSQSKSGLQSKVIFIPGDHSGKVLQGHRVDSCHVESGHAFPRKSVADENIALSSHFADETDNKSAARASGIEASIPEHFVNAFHCAKKFPAKSAITHSQNSRHVSTGSQPFADENQENQSPNISAALESGNVNSNDASTKVAQNMKFSNADSCSETGSSEIKLVTETAEKCVYARKAKAGRKSARRNKAKTEDVRRPSRDRLSLGIAERTKMSSNSSSSSPYSHNLMARQSNSNTPKNTYGRIIKDDMQLLPGYTYSDVSPTKSNWTVAVEIENASAMFGE